MLNAILFFVAVIIFFMFWRILLPVVVVIAVAFFGTIYYQEWQSKSKTDASDKWDDPATAMPKPINIPTPANTVKMPPGKTFVDGTPWSPTESDFREFKEKKAGEETQKLWEASQKEIREREEAEFKRIAGEFFVVNSGKVYAMRDLAYKCKISWVNKYATYAQNGACKGALKLRNEIVIALKTPAIGSVPISIMRKYHANEMAAIDSGVEALKYATALANAEKEPEKVKPEKQYNPPKSQAAFQRAKPKNSVKRKFDPVWEH